MLGAAAVGSAYVPAMVRSRAVRNTDALAVTWGQPATATGVFAVAALSVGPAPWTAASYGPARWAWLLLLSLFCTLFSFFLQMWAARATPPSWGSLLLGTQLLRAAVFGITIAGNRMGPLAPFGGVLALVVTEWGRRTALVPRPAAGEREGAPDAAAPSPEPARG
ncbi:EamA family transporter [Kitasatospora sp. NPDC059722]|uniref:EamA family transporter n=1 Tax=Kitasatospora sp. NPDC059722 TaxID=3346925 RepID=UPI0036A771C7